MLRGFQREQALCRAADHRPAPGPDAGGRVCAGERTGKSGRGGRDVAEPRPGARRGTAAGSGQRTAFGSRLASTGPTVRGLPTPVGSNLPPQQPEPLSLLAYLLIALAVVWFVAAIVGIVRLLMRPTRGPYAVAYPEPEQDRPFLSLIMPFGALITVAIIVTIFGVSFLMLARISPKMFDTEIYPLAVDLFIVCFVMFVATILALRGSKAEHPEVH